MPPTNRSEPTTYSYDGPASEGSKLVLHLRGASKTHVTPSENYDPPSSNPFSDDPISDYIIYSALTDGTDFAIEPYIQNGRAIYRAFWPPLNITGWPSTKFRSAKPDGIVKFHEFFKQHSQDPKEHEKISSSIEKEMPNNSLHQFAEYREKGELPKGLTEREKDSILSRKAKDLLVEHTDTYSKMSEKVVEHWVDEVFRKFQSTHGHSRLDISTVHTKDEFLRQTGIEKEAGLVPQEMDLEDYESDIGMKYGNLTLEEVFR
ncbi:uncharacterized protein I206_101389 [Kwoniella pini CBS 10737]|uniref:Uncharacterized protein n=1 Tax=Kwoniella pini CBS 10737 TaxID=1296096 RepID=A0A1B9HWS8_9TREE|nr:uncharacterized protein I206_06641 [Kwoniella pini CBS 10737]OCF47735.1 hypothetical protein I206_06641 [Kwoniella pini CBS 10737]